MMFVVACGDEPSTLKCPTTACGYTQISAGYEHTCAVYSAVAGSADGYGQVVCWGENRDGRCGAATGAGESQARQPVVVADLNDAVSVSAGGTQTCALRANGKVVCWGSNAFGELGDGEEDGSFAPVEPQFPVMAADRVQIAAGGSSLGGTACVRDADRQLWCWGRNHANQVRPGNDEKVSGPVRIQTVDNAADVSIGQDFACVIDGGQLLCWGDAFFATAPSALPAVTSPILGSLSSKGFMTCARSDTDVQCFTGLYPAPCDECEDGTRLELDLVRTPIAGALQVSTGTQHTCALTSSHEVVCWGSASNGRLGLGTAIDPNDPTNELTLRPVTIENATGHARAIEQIASGASHSCALDTKHDIYCWGDNTQGQLGDGSETGQRSVPTLVQLAP